MLFGTQSAERRVIAHPAAGFDQGRLGVARGAAEGEKESIQPK